MILFGSPCIRRFNAMLLLLFCRINAYTAFQRCLHTFLKIGKKGQRLRGVSRILGYLLKGCSKSVFPVFLFTKFPRFFPELHLTFSRYPLSKYQEKALSILTPYIKNAHSQERSLTTDNSGQSRYRSQRPESITFYQIARYFNQSGWNCDVVSEQQQQFLTIYALSHTLIVFEFTLKL